MATNPNPRPLHWLRPVLAALCALAALWPARGGATPTSPFVAALGGLYDGPGNPIGPELFLSDPAGPLLASVGNPGTAAGQFRAAFGSNGFDIQVVGGLNRAVYGGSMWSDGVTVNGSAGQSLLSVSTRVRGDVLGQVEMSYALFVSSRPFDLQVIIDAVSASSTFSGLSIPHASRAMFTGVANRCGLPGAIGDCGTVPFQNFQGHLDTTLHADVPFVYGQTLYFASLFEGGVDVLGGSARFFNSADFGITVRPGMSVQSLSGTSYVIAVPEPSAALMLLGGLAGLAALRRRR